MSAMKKEPEWISIPAQGLSAVPAQAHPAVGWWRGLNTIDFDDIYYYVKPAGEQQKDWDMVPESIKATYEKLGIPAAERKYLAGVTAVRVRGRLSPQSGGPGEARCPLHRHGHGAS